MSQWDQLLQPCLAHPVLLFGQKFLCHHLVLEVPVVLICLVHHLFLLHPFRHRFHHFLSHLVPQEVPLDQLDHLLQKYHQVPVLLFVHLYQGFLVLLCFHLLRAIQLDP